MSATGEWLAAGLARIGIDSLEHADRLPWLALLLAVTLLAMARRRPPAIAWPGLVEARVAGARSPEASSALALLLRAMALACLALVLAGPVGVRRVPPEPGLGIDLVLVVDTSGSMRALDADLGQQTRTRLDLAKQVVSRFASRRVAEGDRVGLVVFGSSAFTQCPLTGDGGLLGAALERVEVGVAGEATALGDALALAVKRAAGARDGDGEGGFVVLLTDGRNNAGSVPVEIASELAAAEGVRVHTVGIGTGGEEVPMAVAGAAGLGLRFERHDPDLDSLRRVAQATGGSFFQARASRDLAAVYQEIDSLERRPRPLPPRVLRTRRAEPLLAAAGGMLLAEIALARVLRRTLP
jgi:Ca-activated chloride channel family protein